MTRITSSCSFVAVSICMLCMLFCDPFQSQSHPVDSIVACRDTFDFLPQWNWDAAFERISVAVDNVGRDFLKRPETKSFRLRAGGTSTWDTLASGHRILRGVCVHVLAWRTLRRSNADTAVIKREALIAATWRSPEGKTLWVLTLLNAERKAVPEGMSPWEDAYPDVVALPSPRVARKGSPARDIPESSTGRRYGSQIRNWKYFTRRLRESDILAFIADIDSVRAKYRHLIPAFWTGVPQPRADYTLRFADGDVRENTWKQVTGTPPRVRFPNGR